MNILGKVYNEEQEKKQTDREKLIELLSEAHNAVTAEDIENDELSYYDAMAIEADYLLSHGVTIEKQGEWISVEERLPKKDGRYLCNYHFGEYPKMTFTQVLDYYATDIVPHFQHTLGDGSMKVTHWMPLPKPPKMKGENNG